MSRPLSPLTAPKISIVIPLFNATGHVEECLDCALASTFEEFEVILVDDGSTDDTSPKVSSYPCRLLKNETNKGAAAARNRGIDESKGEVILLLDSDVLIPPDLLARVWDFFEKHPGVAILQARYGDKPYYPNLFSQYKHYVFSFRGRNPGNQYVLYIHTACVAIRKNVFQKFRFDENIKRREDVDFGLRCQKEGLLIYAEPSLTVGHKKRYDLLSFSRYQFQSARELVLQHRVTKNKNFSQEIFSRGTPFYKKMWLLRPLLCLLLIGDLIWLGVGGGLSALLLLAFILTFSFLLEYRFRLYLFRVAPLKISLWAWFLYFYDGLLTGLGMLTAMVSEPMDVRKVEPSGSFSTPDGSEKFHLAG